MAKILWLTVRWKARLLFVGSLAFSVTAQAGLNNWTKIGPFLEGGSVQALVVDPVTLTTVYAVSSGGIFRSVNGGSRWDLVSAGLVYASPRFASGFGFVSAGSIFSFAIDPKNPSTLYAGTGGLGVFKSVDAGATWTQTDAALWGKSDYSIVHDLAIDPQSPATLYAATFSGIFRSTDGGASWIPRGGVAATATVLRVDPRSPSTLYAGTYLPVPCPGGLICPPTGGLYRSFDGGATWKDLSQRLLGISAGPYPAISDLTFSSYPAAVYAATSVGLFQSKDDGETWRRIEDGLPAGSVESIAAGTMSSTIYAATEKGVFRSGDSGAGWEPVSKGLPGLFVSKLATASSSSVAFPPYAPTTVYASTNAGLAKSEDGGSSWIPLHDALQKLSVDFLVRDPISAPTLYAGNSQYFSGLGVVKTNDGGQSWRFANSGLTDLRVFRLEINPDSTETLYALTPSGVFKTTNSGASWFAVTGLPARVFALAIDPRTTSTLYAATAADGLLKSVDDGVTWKPAMRVCRLYPSAPSRSTRRIPPSLRRQPGSCQEQRRGEDLEARQRRLAAGLRCPGWCLASRDRSGGLFDRLRPFLLLRLVQNSRRRSELEPDPVPAGPPSAVRGHRWDVQPLPRKRRRRRSEQRGSRRQLFPAPAAALRRL